MNHTELDAWKKSIEFVTEIYEITKDFPQSEMYGLTNQMRRSAVSIPSNIAEGCTRYSDKETSQFLYVALASASEIETQIVISNNLKYINDHLNLLEKLNDIRKLIKGLLNYLKNKK